MDLSVTNYIIFQNFIYSNYTESATNFVNTFIPITGTIHLAGTRLMTPSPKKGWIFFGKPFGSPTIKLDFGLRGGALWAIFQKNLNRTFFWTMYQCCNEASKIFEASKIIVQRLIFIFGQFSETKESSKLQRLLSKDWSSSSSLVSFQKPKNLRSFEDFLPKILKIFLQKIHLLS